MGIEVRPTGAGFSIAWPEYAIRGKVFRLREEKHALRGEVSLWHQVGETRLDLYQETMNFDSTRSQSSAVKALAAFGDNGWEPDWLLLVATLRKQVPTYYRQGAPLLLLAGDPEDYPIHLHYIVRPLLFQRESTMLFGLGGAAKGWVATALCMMAQTGTGGYGLTVPRPATPLYLDWESTEGELNRRIALLKAGGLCPDARIPYRRCTAPLADDLDDILDMVSGVGADFVVMDSLLGACGEDLEKNQGVSRFYHAFRALTVGGLIITHTQKNLKPSERTAFGAGHWTFQARSVWSATGMTEPGSKETSVALSHTKVNMGRLSPPLGLRFSFTPDPYNESQDIACHISTAAPEDIPGALKSNVVDRLAIKAAIQAAPGSVSTVKDLSVSTDLEVDTLRMTLNREKGWFAKVGQIGRETVWGLV